MKIILGDPRATPKNVLSSHLIISKGNELDLSAVVADVHSFMNGHLPWCAAAYETFHSSRWRVSFEFHFVDPSRKIYGESGLL